jgi:hypothetical protein
MSQTRTDPFTTPEDGHEKAVWANPRFILICALIVEKFRDSLEFLLLLLWRYSPCGFLPLFQFPNLYTFGRTPWTRDQPVAKPLPTYRTTQTQNKRTETCML